MKYFRFIKLKFISKIIKVVLLSSFRTDCFKCYRTPDYKDDPLEITDCAKGSSSCMYALSVSQNSYI